MSTILVTQVDPLFTQLAQDTDLGTAGGTTATLALIESGSQSAKMGEVDNTANSSVDSYVKLYNSASTGAGTLGTTAPTAILYAPKGDKICYTVPAGMAFSSGIVWTCVTSAGTAGTAPPASSVAARLLYG